MSKTRRILESFITESPKMDRVLKLYLL